MVQCQDRLECLRGSEAFLVESIWTAGLEQEVSQVVQYQELLQVVQYQDRLEDVWRASLMLAVILVLVRVHAATCKPAPPLFLCRHGHRRGGGVEASGESCMCVNGLDEAWLLATAGLSAVSKRSISTIDALD